MARVPALLIVLTLTGSPAATLACANRCEAESARTMRTCHDGDSLRRTVGEGDIGNCLALFAWDPFLKENRERSAKASVAVTPNYATPLRVTLEEVALTSPGAARLPPPRSVLRL